jgi:uncharacterized protein YndB with AHSA1/START domain
MPDQLTQLRAASRGLVIKRLFDAPPELVWMEWTDPSRLAQWFGGTEVEVPLSSVALDLIVGGAWTATTVSHDPARQQTCWHGEYVEILAPERLTFTISGLPGVPGPDLVTITLTPVGEDRTEMLFRQQGQRTAGQYELARERWSREFDQIALRLTDC